MRDLMDRVEIAATPCSMHRSSRTRGACRGRDARSSSVAVGVADLDRLDPARTDARRVDVNGGRFRGRQYRIVHLPIGRLRAGVPVVDQHAGVAVRDRHHLARQFVGQAAEVETAVRLAEAQRIAVADDQQSGGLAPQAQHRQRSLGHSRRHGPPAAPARRGSGPSAAPGPRCRIGSLAQAELPHQAGVVADHAVVNEPAAAGRVRMVVAVVLRRAVRRPAAVADHHRRAAAGVQVAQVGRGGARALEGMDGPRRRQATPVRTRGGPVVAFRWRSAAGGPGRAASRLS